MKKIILFFSAVFLIATTGFSQVITVTPALPTDQNSVEVIFDASQGIGGLAGYTGDVYAHTGVTTNLSSGWTYVITPWPNATNLSLANTEKNKLVSLGNNKWKLVISPSIRSYYNVPAGEVIKKMAFVFRNADGSKEGKTSPNPPGDIFYDVFPSSIGVQITNPSSDYVFVGLNETLTVEASSVFADSTLLYVEGLKVAGTNTDKVTYTITASAYGRFQVIAKAKTATAAAYDTLYYTVRPPVTVAELPAGMKDGINYLSETSVLLSLYAPFKNFAYAVGDFNNWQPTESTYMKRTPDGKRYWVQIDGLTPGKEYIYQYMVDGSIYIGDPYAQKVSDPWNDQYIDNATYPGLIPYPNGKTQGIATVFQTAQKTYSWKTTTFTPPQKTDLVIYELLVRDFTAKHTFQGIIDTIGYLHTLGVNAIELMPVNEYDGNWGWGYNPNYYFAVDKSYGPANKLKQLIDTCHQLGIAVLGDLVLDHSSGTSPLVMLYWDGSKPAANNPWYNVSSPNPLEVWGPDVNHESADTKKLVDSITSFWMSEFRLDGFRFDWSKGFTNKVGDGWAYDASRIANVERMATEIWKKKPEAYVILEHWTDNPEEKELSNFGCMLWGNVTGSYDEAAKGVTANSDLTWGVYTSRGWNNPHLVTYKESHDEEREMFKCITEGLVSGNYSTQDTATALKRAALTATFLLTIPGPKMIWQFGERGYDYSINYPSGTESSRLANKPPHWDYMNNNDRKQLYNLYKRLIYLKKSNPVFSATDIQLDVAGAVKKIKLNSGNKSAVVLGNFDVISSNVSPGFSHTGKWYDYITGDSITVTDVNANLIFKPGEYRIYLSEKFVYPNGIESQKKEPFSVIVAPNPVSDLCNILISYSGSDVCEISDYSLLGSESAKVFSGRINSKLQIPWTPKGKGIHILKVRIGNQQVIRKVVVQ